MGNPVSLVTGVAGFIGSHLAEHLIQMGHDVIGLDDLSGGFEDNIPQGVKVMNYGSITDRFFTDDCVKLFKPDYIFHLAAYAAEGLSHFIKRYNYTNNVIGSVNLINAAVNCGVKRFVFTSSIAVYGSQQVPFTEDMIPQPEDSYGIAKYAVEQELKISHEMFGLDYTIFRPHNVYGERQNIGDKYRNVVGIFMNQCLKGEPMTIFGDGSQRRGFTHISNVAQIIADSINCPNMNCETFNIGSLDHASVLELAGCVASSMGIVEPQIKMLPARKEVAVAISCHDKLRDALGGVIGTLSLKSGVGLMAAWVRERGARQSAPFQSIEIRKNLPESWR